MALTPCSDLSAAGWLLSGDRRWNELVGFGPAGFPAYARLRFLPDPAFEGQSENDVDDGGIDPSAALRTVVETLSRHTRTPDDCYFCLWEGWGSTIWGEPVDEGRPADTPRRPRIAPAFPSSVLHGPKVAVPDRSYFLFRGRWADIGNWDVAELWPGQPRRDMPDPAFIWPADHAWCIANDVDPHWAGIGADLPAIDELIANPDVDIVPADPREDQPCYR